MGDGTNSIRGFQLSKNDRRNRHNEHKTWNNNSKKTSFEQEKVVPQRTFTNPENQKDIQRKESAIREYKARSVICPICGEAITDMTTAIANKDSGAPMHFDCVIKKISETEKLLENQSINYIGQGRFAVITFENPRDLRKFKIERIIEWEERNKAIQWRQEMSDLYSQIK